MFKATTLGSSLLLFVVAFACRGSGDWDIGPKVAGGDPGADRLLALAQCSACHALPDDANGLAGHSMAPDLANLGGRMGAKELRAYLREPSAVRARTRMPNLLAGLSDKRLEKAVEALSWFLLGNGEQVLSRRPSDGVFRLSHVEQGRQLFHSVGCVACHGAFDSPAGLEMSLGEYENPLEVATSAAALREINPGELWDEAPPLDDLGSVYDSARLADFILNPLETRPYGVMPDLGLTEGEAAAIASYLLFEDGIRDGSIVSDQVEGLSYQYFEGDFMEEGPPAFDRLEAVRTGHVYDLAQLPANRGDRFGFRYTGFILVPVAGEWTFATNSDDGSWLWIDGKPVVANGGSHAPMERQGSLELSAGRHEIEVRYFELSGGELLDVRWQGPGMERETIPLSALSSMGLRSSVEAPAPGDTEMTEKQAESLRRDGANWFRIMRCVACHPMDGIKPTSMAAPFASLGSGIEAGDGCLSNSPKSRVPFYPQALVQAGGALREAARSAASGNLSLGPEETLHTTLATMRCTACHGREGVGAPSEDRLRHFAITEGVDLGDEGRVPPELDLAGWKLKDSWLRQVLAEGTKVREHMLTRMPRFGMANIEHLVELLPAVDRPSIESPEPIFTTTAAADAQLLMGTDGLGCVQCHDFAGYKGLGVPAVDLTRSHERLRWPWFRALLADPGSLNMNTRMPVFWTSDGRSPVQEILGGDPEAQVEAIWASLSLGDASPLPKGLAMPEGAYELTPLEEPLLVSVFWKGASARTTLVGFPDRLHVAFDVENSRLDSAWRGRFFDARGTWHARAGALESPPTEDVLRFAAGPAFASLDSPDMPWPGEVGRSAGWRVHGREFDSERRPIFVYGQEELGGLIVRERPAPVLRGDGAWLVRDFELRADYPDGLLVMRAAEADRIEQQDDGSYRTSSGARFVIVGAEARLRSTGGGVELLVAIPWNGNKRASFSIETTWTQSTESPR